MVRPLLTHGNYALFIPDQSWAKAQTWSPSSATHESLDSASELMSPKD